MKCFTVAFSHFTSPKVIVSVAEYYCLLHPLWVVIHNLNNLRFLLSAQWRSCCTDWIKGSECKGHWDPLSASGMILSSHSENSAFLLVLTTFLLAEKYQIGETSNVPFFCTSFTLMKCCCLPRRSLEIKYISTHAQISWSLKQRESNGFQGLYQC